MLEVIDRSEPKSKINVQVSLENANLADLISNQRGDSSAYAMKLIFEVYQELKDVTNAGGAEPSTNLKVARLLAEAQNGGLKCAFDQDQNGQTSIKAYFMVELAQQTALMQGSSLELASSPLEFENITGSIQNDDNAPQ